MSPPRAWVEAKRLDSALAVTAGNPPAVRSGTLACLPERGTLIGGVGRGGLICEDPNLRLSDLVDGIFTDGHPTYVYPDRRAALSVVKALGSSDSRVWQRAGEAVDHMTRMPSANGRQFLLSNALATRFWCPQNADPSKLESWAAAFKVSGPTAGIDLAVAVRDAAWGASRLAGETHPFLDELDTRLRSAGRSVEKSVVFGGVQASIRAWRATVRLCDTWEFVERVDPNLRDLSVLTGESVRFTPRHMVGDAVVGPVSTPCRLRAGEVFIVNPETAEYGTTELLSLGFDESLTATLKHRPSLVDDIRPGLPGPRVRGYAVLDRAWGDDRDLLLTSSLISFGSDKGSATRWTGKVGPARKRQLPLDVALGG